MNELLIRKNIINCSWEKMFRNHKISSWFYHFTGNFKNDTICQKPQIYQPKLGQFQHSGTVLKSSGRADFKTVPGFGIWARFIGDIKGFSCPKWRWPPLYLSLKTNDIILKISSKMIKLRENLMKFKPFVPKIALFILRHFNIKKINLRNADELLGMSN